MSTFTLLLIGLVTLTQAIPDKQYDLNDAERHFEEFIQTYGKMYANEEEKASRFEIFKETLTDINKKNLEEDLAEFDITKFADLTIEEFIKFRGGYRKSERRDEEICTIHNSVPDVKAPESWDWNKEGAVTSVKQQECGDCYAFSAIGNVEGQSKILTKHLTDYSVQQIIDCDPLDAHCEGGDMQLAIMSLNYMHGAVSASTYPYKGKQQTCYFDVYNMVKIRVTGCDTYRNITENDLLKLVYQRGPLSIGIDATSLFKYTKGIMKQCVHERPNHGVLLVGYGTEDGVPYWLFKNSWGTDFGEKGYFRVKRGTDACGLIDYEITSAIVKSLRQ